MASTVVAHIDESRFEHDVTNYRELISDAAKATDEEHNAGFMESFKTHRRAVIWSILLSTALVMEGYDVVVIGSFYGQPAFLNRFGVPDPHSSGKIIPASWQSALNDGSSAGAIIGLLVNGWACEKFGAKVTMMTALVWLVGAIAVDFFGNSLGMLTAGSVLCGVAWGVFQVLTTAYASEVCPIHLRHYLTAFINMCWGMGILISSGVVKAVSTRNDNFGWRLPFALQWIWIPYLAVVIAFAPVSPWWLVRQGRYADAEKSVRSLTNKERFTDEECKRSVAMMIYTTELEKIQEEGSTYLDCFKGVNRRRSEIVSPFALLRGQILIARSRLVPWLTGGISVVRP
ncbi:MFS general substrate transporter [Clavulina sp. PMI_390]|nr:MFS general substrate transporter [Clavulina sp. PMI_390]